MLRTLLARTSTPAAAVASAGAAAARRTAALQARALTTTPACRSGAAVTTAQIKQLREMTGAPMMDCKTALVTEGGDMDKAIDWLRKKGVAAASKKAGRVAAQGLVATAVAPSGETGVVVEVRHTHVKGAVAWPACV